MDVHQAWDLLQTAGADPLEVARAAETVKSFSDARQISAINQVAEENPVVFDPSGHPCDPAPAEIACALAWTPATASRRVDLAQELHEELPMVLDALRTGQIDLGKAQEITLGTVAMTPEGRTALAGGACHYAADHTRGQLRAWLARQIAKVEPEAAERRRKRARKDRRVWVRPETDGMASLGAYLTAEEAQSCYESLRVAASNTDGPVDSARADELVARLTGIGADQPIPVQVLITPAGHELAGYGPISPTHAHQLCDGSPRIRLDKPKPEHRIPPQSLPHPIRQGPRPALPLPRLPTPRRALRPRPHLRLAHRNHH